MSSVYVRIIIIYRMYAGNAVLCIYIHESWGVKVVLPLLEKYKLFVFAMKEGIII